MNNNTKKSSGKLITALVPVFATFAVVSGVLAPSAHAIPLVPDTEGELNVGVGSCLGSGCSYLSINPLVESIQSIPNPTTGAKSRLFVDRAGTENSYGPIRFLVKDKGTNDSSDGFWFRPVAMRADGITPLDEQGQLEVGTFKITFAQPVSDLDISWFDVEKERLGKETSYVVEYGDGTTAKVVVNAGENSNIKKADLNNVKAITLNLGGKGDGVIVQASSSAIAQTPAPPTGGGDFPPPRPRPIVVQPAPEPPVKGLW